MKKMAVSIYVFDFMKIGEKIKELINNQVNWFHIDIMDGIFVNNYALCQKFCNDIKTNFPTAIIDAHLMCIHPEKQIKAFANSGVDNFTFHYESITNKEPANIIKIIEKIKKYNMRPVLAINPETNPEIIYDFLENLDGVMCMSIKPGFNGQTLNPIVYENIKKLKEIKIHKKLNFFIQIDGGVREDTYELLKEAGGEVFVVGAFINNKDTNLKDQIKKIEG